MVGNVGEVLWVVMGTIALVMLLACANVTNLLLVRAEARQQELALRAALGAGVARIVRGLLVESVMLGLIGGVLGVGFAYAGLRLLVAIGPADLPRLNEISLDRTHLRIHADAFGVVRALSGTGPGIQVRRSADFGRPAKRGPNASVSRGAASRPQRSGGGPE